LALVGLRSLDRYASFLLVLGVLGLFLLLLMLGLLLLLAVVLLMLRL